MNPEFQRYLWLELTPQRLVMMPAIQVLIFGLVWLNNDKPADDLEVTAYWLTLLVGGLWSTRVAGETVIEEVAEGTWDQQRLSSLSPWSMTWGKLLGAPIYVWYGCILAMAVMITTTSARLGMEQALFHGITLVLMLLFAQAVSMMMSLHAASREATIGRRLALVLQLVGLAALFPWAILLTVSLLGEFEMPVMWFAMPVAPQHMLLASLTAFTAWAIVGCYRLMRQELRVPNSPWVWLGFVLFCVIYGLGWAWDSNVLMVADIPGHIQGSVIALSHHGTVAIVITLLAAYIVLLAEVKDPVELRRLLMQARDGQWSAVTETVPLWVCTGLIAIIITVALWFAVISANHYAPAIFCSAMVGFFLRDAGLVMFLNLGRRRARADAAALVYLTVLYALVPAIIYGMFKLNIAGLLYPGTALNLQSLGLVTQIAVIWYLVMRRWRTHWAQ